LVSTANNAAETPTPFLQTVQAPGLNDQAFFGFGNKHKSSQKERNLKI
jgi:hypothetical protein